MVVLDDEDDDNGYLFLPPPSYTESAAANATAVGSDEHSLSRRRSKEREALGSFRARPPPANAWGADDVKPAGRATAAASFTSSASVMPMANNGAGPAIRPATAATVT